MSAVAEAIRKEISEEHPGERSVRWPSVWWRWSGQRDCPRHASMSRNALLAVCASLITLLPVPASATFHLMKIMEIFPGTDSQPTAQYVMLQMYASGQNHVGGHFVTVYDANGGKLGTFTFGSDVANGANRATILIATPDAQSLFGVEADLEMTTGTVTPPTPTPQPGGGTPPGPYGMTVYETSPAGVLLQPAGGAVCWDVIDCVAWGSFDAPSALPMTEGPVIAPTGLTLGMAMHRDFTDDAGDTTDFALAPPAPRNNAGQTGALPETPTPAPEPTVTATPPSAAGNTPAAAGNTPGAVAPLTTNSDMGSSGSGGGGGCAVEPSAHGTWSGALLVLLPVLSLVRRRSQARSGVTRWTR